MTTETEQTIVPCECCNGTGFMIVSDAVHDDQTIKQPCGACASKGFIKLTSSEAVTHKKFNTQ